MDAGCIFEKINRKYWICVDSWVRLLLEAYENDRQIDNGLAIISHKAALFQKTTDAARGIVPMIWFTNEVLSYEIDLIITFFLKMEDST